MLAILKEQTLNSKGKSSNTSRKTVNSGDAISSDKHYYRRHEFMSPVIVVVAANTVAAKSIW